MDTATAMGANAGRTRAAPGPAAAAPGPVGVADRGEADTAADPAARAQCSRPADSHSAARCGTRYMPMISCAPLEKLAPSALAGRSKITAWW